MAPNVGLGTQGPDQKGWDLWIASVVGVLLAAVFVAARLAQRRLKSEIGLDDYMIVAALVASGLLTMTECQAVVYGYGRKWNDLDPSTRITARKWFYGAQIMYKVVLMLNKVAIVCLYYRIFAVASLKFRRACHAVNAFIVITGIVFIIGTVVQCQPIAYFWDKEGIDGQCLAEQPWWISYSVLQIFADVLLLALPVHQVLSLRMTMMEKAGLVFIFATGLFVTFASIYRATTLAQSASSADPTQGPIPATVWSVVEANAGIICACLPMLRHPFLRIFGPIFSPLFPSGIRSNRSNNYHTSRRSYVFGVPLPSRNTNRGSVAVASDSKRDPFGPEEFITTTTSAGPLDQDEEERVTESRGSAYVPSAGQGFGPGIVVQKDVIVQSQTSYDMKAACTEATEATCTQSVQDDERSRKSAYMHV